MTEKRYILKSDGFLIETVVDTFENIEMSAEGVVDDLNTLHEEKEQLKQRVAFLEEFLKSGVQYEYYQKVYDENEQLKQQIQQLKQWNKCLAEKRHQELKGDVE